MNRPVVVDTDLVIDYLRGRGPGAALVPELLRSTRLRLTAVTLFELRVGLDWERRGPQVQTLFTGGPLPFDKASALHAGSVETALRSAGTVIGTADVQQAGICLAAGLPLATRNREHFQRVPRLSLYDASDGS